MMYKTYRQIAKHVATGMPELAWIDRDKGQLDNPGQFHSVQVPGLLLDFSETEWQGGTRGNQIGHATLTASLVLRLPAATYHGSDPSDSLWSDYVEYEHLVRLLHTTLSSHPAVGDRTQGRDYYTKNFYVCVEVYDLTVYHTVDIKIIERPVPDISATLNIPINDV